MKVSPKIKIVLGLLVVFLAGAVCGAWGHAKIAERAFLKIINHRTWAETMLNGLDKELNLSPDQEQKARVMLDESVSQVVASFCEIGKEMMRLHTRLQTILTPEQQEKNAREFERFHRELRDKFHLNLPQDAGAAGRPSSSTVTSTN